MAFDATESMEARAEGFRQAYDKVKAEIGKLWPHLTTDRFRNLADFYSLWAAVLDITDMNEGFDVQVTARRLSSFGESVREGASGDAQAYLIAATQGSNKAPNRRLRAGLLRAQFA